jgi:hypothetical protein
VSQSALRSVRKGEEVYCELLDFGAQKVAYGVGPTERMAADAAERSWRATYGTAKPERKVLLIRKQFRNG